MADRPLILDLQNMEPNDLVRRARDGCADSFGELCRRFRPRLLHVLRPRLDGHWADAEDVAQEALAKAFRHLATFDSRFRFSTWLYTIAFRLAHDHVRCRRRHRQHLSLEQIGHSAVKDRAEAVAEQREEIVSIWSTAQSSLKKSQYTALWLRYGEDLPVVEIARIMGMTQIGVRVLLHRARLRLTTVISTDDCQHRRPQSHSPRAAGATL